MEINTCIQDILSVHVLTHTQGANVVAGAVSEVMAEIEVAAREVKQQEIIKKGASRSV